MNIRSISLKGVSGADSPTSVAVNPGVTRLALDPRLASALPSVIMTLLYPEEVSSTDIARLAGPQPASAWRVEFEEAGTIFRVSRSFSADSITLEVRDGDEWRSEGRGATEVRRALGQLVKLPPPTVMEALNFWINVNPSPQSQAKRAASGVEGMLLGTQDYFGNLDETAMMVEEEMPDEERSRISDEYRKTLTIEFVDAQLAHANDRVEDLIARIGAVVDESGELAKISRELARLPEVRELSAEERALFADPDGQMGTLQERLAKIEAELESEDRAKPRGGGGLWSNHGFVFGLFGTIVFTVLSIINGPEARRFALLNVATLGVAFAGFWQWAGGKAAGGRTGRKRALLERRRDATREQYETLRNTVERLRDELPVSSLAELEKVVERRTELEGRLALLKSKHEAAFETPEYKRLEAKKERAERKLRALELARRRLGEADVHSYELSSALQRGGVDPTVALWRPEAPSIELRRRVKRLGQVASKYRLVSESGLNPKTVKSWMRVAERIVDGELPALNLSPEHQMVNEDGEDVLDTMDISTATAVVEAFRMSLHLTLVKAKAPGIFSFAIDVHPDRVEDVGVRKRLDKMYKGLGERLQVLVVTGNS